MTSFQCVEAFSPTIVCFEGEQNYKGYGPQSEQYLHSWGGAIIDGIRVMPYLEVWALHVRTHVPIRE